RILDAARAADHEIGLHGSYFTMLDAGRFRAEGERLARVAGGPPRGVRQHFLRMRPGGTQHAMLAAGFEYDATYGFADRNGFRLGVADVVPAWDAAHQTAGGLDEVPLVWMDRALTKYGRVEDPEVWITDAVELAQAAQEVDGLWVGLWHPNQTAALGYPGAPQTYVRLVRLLLERRPFVATLGTAVEWRRARRAVRASRVAPHGRGSWSRCASSSRGCPRPAFACWRTSASTFPARCGRWRARPSSPSRPAWRPRWRSRQPSCSRRWRSRAGWCSWPWWRRRPTRAWGRGS